jgi:hypothetical protein
MSVNNWPTSWLRGMSCWSSVTLRRTRSLAATHQRTSRYSLRETHRAARERQTLWPTRWSGQRPTDSFGLTTTSSAVPTGSIASSRRANAAGRLLSFPRFIGTRWWRLIEPSFAVIQTLSMYTGRGTWGDNVWGGGITFTRDDVDVETVIADLRRTVSDDALLSKRLDTIYVARSLPADV